MYFSSKGKDIGIISNELTKYIQLEWSQACINFVSCIETVLEVYQFARDAAVAEAWLIAQEPYLLSSDLGYTIDEVENLIKKHEAFEKSAQAQEERFIALERLTTVSKCHTPVNSQIDMFLCSWLPS